MASSSAYIDTRTVLSSGYYLRSFYTSDRDARTSSKRNTMDSSALSLADSKALRRAIKELGNMEYNEEQEDSIRNTALAFIETFNNTLSSASKTADQTLNRTAKQLKALANEYASDLENIGVTIEANGSLSGGSSLFSSANISKFEKLFGKDSDLMQRTSAYAKRAERRSDALVTTTEYQKQSSQAAKAGTQTIPENHAASIAQLFSEGTDLNTVLKTGIGKNINIML